MMFLMRVPSGFGKEPIAAERTTQEATFEWSLAEAFVDRIAMTVLFMVFATAAEQFIEFVIEANGGPRYG